MVYKAHLLSQGLLGLQELINPLFPIVFPHDQDQAAMVAAQYDRDVERIYQLLDLQSTMRKVSEGIKIDFFGVSQQSTILWAR